MYNGLEKIPQEEAPTLAWSGSFSGANRAPFYFDGMTWDEFFVEDCYYLYHHAKLARDLIPYKTIKKQLEDGDINSIPDEYKITCPFPENCTAYKELINENLG